MTKEILKQLEDIKKDFEELSFFEKLDYIEENFDLKAWYTTDDIHDTYYIDFDFYSEDIKAIIYLWYIEKNDLILNIEKAYEKIKRMLEKKEEIQERIKNRQ